jgi:hypothetical protein
MTATTNSSKKGGQSADHISSLYVTLTEFQWQVVKRFLRSSLAQITRVHNHTNFEVKFWSPSLKLLSCNHKGRLNVLCVYSPPFKGIVSRD